jgi:hypothetical protein
MTGSADERAVGMAAGDVWRLAAELTVFYVDLGWSPGMLRAREICETNGLPWVERRLDPERLEVPLLDGSYVVDDGSRDSFERQSRELPYRVEKLVLPSDADEKTIEALQQAGYQFLTGRPHCRWHTGWRSDCDACAQAAEDESEGKG